MVLSSDDLLPTQKQKLHNVFIDASHSYLVSRTWNNSAGDHMEQPTVYK